MLKKNPIKKIRIFLTFNTGSVHKKFQPNQFSRLAGYRQHIYIYECLVLLHRFTKQRSQLYRFSLFGFHCMNTKKKTNEINNHVICTILVLTFALTLPLFLVNLNLIITRNFLSKMLHFRKLLLLIFFPGKIVQF